ncbi:P-loop ATPase, Sll1717 family [Vogesella indigofera]|uniref:P-loop ATPase, Sll1717 family n=1 Tax=Vogesella indigofera TaxID=45465 RepID=UPI00234F232E|nr:hypothetical protein [Vogesella indigofera]MDC7706331.1 hypothetical protein [Vogesella indigofera]
MQSKTKILTEASFGSRIAEDEVDELHSYFVETEQWRKVLSGDVDIIFGSKGAGKSALYSLLVSQKENLRLGRRTVFLAAENPRGTPAFRDLTTAPPMSEEHFRGLWKLYFLSISANYIRHHLDSTQTENKDANSVIDFLASNGLLAPNVTLITRLKAALDYFKRYLPAIEGGVTDPITGLTLTGKITLSEPTTEQMQQGYQSLDNLLIKLNSGYQKLQITAWLALDRLDVAFSDSDELEGNAIRSLFRTYLDMLALSQIKIKIFLRDDIWKKVVRTGFREASHVTRTLTLSWDQQSLLNLIVRRLAANDLICKKYGLDRDTILNNAPLQKEFFYKIFPTQIDVGASKPSTLDWMLSRTADGTKRTAPRELIHLLLATRDEQLRLNQLGNSEPDADRLFDKNSIRSALPPVSKVRYEQTLCAENPTLKPYLEKLEREKTQQSRETLSKIFKCSTEKASEIAEKLVETGFFERRGTKDSPSYWVPFLYRDALEMVQGSASR